MYCNHCGAENPAGAKFCTSCGSRLETEDHKQSQDQNHAKQDQTRSSQEEQKKARYSSSQARKENWEFAGEKTGEYRSQNSFLNFLANTAEHISQSPLGNWYYQKREGGTQGIWKGLSILYLGLLAFFSILILTAKSLTNGILGGLFRTSEYPDIAKFFGSGTLFALVFAILGLLSSMAIAFGLTYLVFGSAKRFADIKSPPGDVGYKTLFVMILCIPTIILPGSLKTIWGFLAFLVGGSMIWQDCMKTAKGNTNRIVEKLLPQYMAVVSIGYVILALLLGSA